MNNNQKKILLFSSVILLIIILIFFIIFAIKTSSNKSSSASSLPNTNINSTEDSTKTNATDPIGKIPGVSYIKKLYNSLIGNNNKEQISLVKNFFDTNYWKNATNATIINDGKGAILVNDAYLSATATRHLLEDSQEKITVNNSNFNVSFDFLIKSPSHEQSRLIVEQNNIEHADDGFGIQLSGLSTTNNDENATLKIRFIKFVNIIEVRYIIKDNNENLISDDQNAKRVKLPESVNISVHENVLTISDTHRNTILFNQKMPFDLSTETSNINIAFLYSNFVESVNIDNFKINENK